MEEFFYQGIWRMDWGLGNPNKTAAIIAQLMIAVWGLTVIRRGGFWVALACFTALGYCLVLTFSRGGLLAAGAGLIVVAAFAPRPWPRIRILAAVLAVLGLAAVAHRVNALDRYSQTIRAPDRSVANRIELWRAAPAMMVDAPAGWGARNSGKAYAQWYQPLDRSTRYRTLVSSHLTWLVEFGWPFRFAYFLAWASVLLLCLPNRRTTWQAVPLGIWISFGIAAIFSSIAESLWVWLVPGLALLATAATRLHSKHWPSPSAWLGPVAAAGFACAIIVAAGFGRTRIHGSADRVVIGAKTPVTWLVVEEKALGGYEFARTLRRYIADNPMDRSVGITRSLACLPDTLAGATVVVAGTPERHDLAKLKTIASSSSRLLLIAPAYYPEEAGLSPETLRPVEVLFGEFSQSDHMIAWEKTGCVHRIAGAGDFLPDWPEIVFERSDLR